MVSGIVPIRNYYKFRYRNPYSFPCGHTFCLIPCIVSPDSNKYEVKCRECERISKVAELSVAEEIARRVYDYKLRNPKISCSNCRNCGGDCGACHFCGHCDEYLCQKCLVAHNEMVSVK